MGATNKQRERIAELERQLREEKAALDYAERACSHQWGESRPDHIHTEGYTMPGDAPGTMGVDRRGPVYVPATTKHQWKRTCAACGKVERTTRTTEKVEQRPAW